MKKILVTGAFGFIGSHLVEFLTSKGYNVIAFDRYNIDNDYGWLNNSRYKKDIEFCLADIRDYDSVYKSLSKASSVFHLAALIGIPYSYISPLAYIRTNIEGTYNILESAKNLNIKNIILTSTSEVYGSAIEKPIKESHRLVGQSPYSASKISADQIGLSYFNSFDLPIKIARPFNVYGPRQSTRAIIPTIINQLLSNSKSIKLGNIDTKRDYTYVTDTCEALLKIYKTNDLVGEIVNIGTNKNYSIRDICSKIFKILNVNPIIKTDRKRVRPNKSEVDELICDNTKIREYCKWQPKISFENGLEKTVKWFEDNKLRYKESDYHV